MRNYYPWSGRGYLPQYDDRADYQTNSKSYMNYLGRVNKSLEEIGKVIDMLTGRDIDVIDTPSIDMTKEGEWSVEYDEEHLHQVIKLKADVILSKITTDGQLNSLFPKPLLLDLKNSLSIKEDGLYSADLYEMIKKLDDHVQTLIDRVDNADPDGAIVLFGNTGQYENRLVSQTNEAQVKANLVKDDPTITNVTLVTDIHLRTKIPGFSDDKEHFSSIHNIQNVARDTHAVFYMGDNMDGLNGQVTDNSGIIPPSNVRYGNLNMYRQIMNALVVNEPVDTYALIGNHDRGGLPYLKESIEHKEQQISSSELAYLAGHSSYGVHKMPDQKVAVIYLDTNDITYEEMLTFDSGISNAQLEYVKAQLEALKNDYHIMILGHHRVDGQLMKNGVALENLLTDFQKVSTNKLIGYFHGHEHYENIWQKTANRTFNMFGLTKAYPETNEIGTANQTGFYVVTINTTNREFTFKSVGHASLNQTIKY